MSPVATGAEFNTRRAVIAGVVAVACGIGLVVLVTQLAGTGTLDVKLGDDRFQDVSASAMADQIAAEGPILFPDAGTTGTRDIILQHFGSDDDDGWIAFAAQRPGQPRDCVLTWDPERELFFDLCDESATVPADGGDQITYPVTVNDGRLTVDLNAAERDADDDVESDSEPSEG